MGVIPARLTVTISIVRLTYKDRQQAIEIFHQPRPDLTIVDDIIRRLQAPRRGLSLH